MCWQASSGILGIWPSHPCESCSLISFCLSHAKKKSWLCRCITNATIVSMRRKITECPFWFVSRSLKCFAALQCHFARRSQVRPHGQWPHDPGEDSQREEGHCAGVRPQSGNSRYGEEWENIQEIQCALKTGWMMDGLYSDLNDEWAIVLITKEHRSLMETAYAYGSKHQFILITGGPVLKYLGYVFPQKWLQQQAGEMKCNCCNRSFIFPVCCCFSTEHSHRSQVWFLHCRDHTGSISSLASDRCLFTTMSKPLTTLNLHSFLQLMDAALVVSIDPLFKLANLSSNSIHKVPFGSLLQLSEILLCLFITFKIECQKTWKGILCACYQTEVYEDPSTVLPPPVPYQHTPQVFLFSQPATAQLDMDTATSLAWRLRGLALVMLVHRYID